ncbi:MAG: mechanosensitive ion channel family protein [Bacteroidales bacterium]
MHLLSNHTYIKKFLIPFILFLVIVAATGLSIQGQDSTVLLMDSIPNPDTIEKVIVKKDTVQGFKLSNLFASDTTSTAQKASSDDSRPLPVNQLISVEKIIWAIIFILIGYFLVKIVISLLNNIAKRRHKSAFAIKRTIPIVRILAWSVIVYIIVMGVFKPPAATVFAFLASVGVAIGFSAQDLLKNVFGGLVVMFDRPFQVGDKIESGKYYGEVTSIGIRSTRIVTPDDSMVTIPNSEFMMQYVSNSNSGENNCQVVAELYLPIDIDTELVRKIATEAAQVSKYIYLGKPIVVLFFNEINNKGTYLKMRLKAYVSNLDKEFYFKSEMTEIVLKSLLEQKIISKEFYKD